MRAIITCNTDETKDAFEILLKNSDVGWWPGEQSDDDLSRHKEEILALVPSENVDDVRATYWFTIYKHQFGKTWGVINRPQNGILEIRLKNQSPVSLRRACENLITSIQNSPHGEKYHFTDIIEVLEPNSQHHAYYGIPLPTRPNEKRRLAIEERRIEYNFARVFLFFAILFLIVTVPPVVDLLKESFSKEWLEWIEGTIGRIATTFLASSFVSGLTVYMHFLDLKRAGAIRWQLKQSDFMK